MDANIHHDLAVRYARDDNYKDALYHYCQAVQAKPDFVLAHYNLGLLLLKHHNCDAAKKQFNNVLALCPFHHNSLFYLGVLYLAEQSLNEAERAFQAVLDVQPDHVDALVNLGVIELKREQGQLAVNYFTKALVLDPTHQDARNNLAATYIHHDRFENALANYTILLQKEPNSIEYLYNSGVAQMALGHLQDAIKQFEAILAQHMSHFEALSNLAAIHMRLGQRSEAMRLLQLAIEVNPADPVSQFMLTVLTGHQKNPEACPPYVMNLFNNYAHHYEKHMLETLDYQLPHQLGRLLHRLNCFHVEHALDLGCGTGLSGIILRELSDDVTGVDIAAKMLAQAKEKGVYDQLIDAELLDYLSNATQSYDLIIAMDVLPYLGDLERLFQSIKPRLSKQGLFIFTTEISESSPWLLQESARFAHHEDYIRGLCERLGLVHLERERVVARRQEGEEVWVMMDVVGLS